MAPLLRIGGWTPGTRTPGRVDGTTPAQAAAELGLSLNAVLVAKSRVLNQWRPEAKGLIDGRRIFLKGLPRLRTS